MKCEATVVCARCRKNKSLWGIRAQKRMSKWVFTWSFPLKEDVAKRERFTEATINAQGERDGKFPGCPYCESKELIYCSGCRRISCYGGENVFHCPWCGGSGEVTHDEWSGVKGGGY